MDYVLLTCVCPSDPLKVRELDLSRDARPTWDEVGRAGIR